MSKAGKSVGVNVVCRFRPCDVDKHLKVSKHHSFELMGGKSASMKRKGGKDMMFHLDMIFNDLTTQEMMFQHVGQPIVHDVLHGYNATIFVYGQTGSGKTHSLFGDMSEMTSQHRGIIPRSCQAIFDHFETAEDIEEVTIKCSFLEIYKEKLQDLLMPDNKDQLKIRENKDKTIYVQGIHEEYVGSFDDVYDLLQIGFRNRVVASTKMNAVSSRSHCVLILKVKQTLKGGTVKESKVNFADLAGSEKVKKTGATGALLEQAKAINQSLSALGNVISALTTKGKKHIPYRDSTLTFLLQDALGGNAKTTLLVAASSEFYNYEETVNTLRFATRAKQMTNKVKINKVMSVAELEVVIAMLKQKLGKANSVISRLQSLVKLMRSDSYNHEEHGSQIDEYLSELARAQEREKAEKRMKKAQKGPAAPIGAVEDDDDDETEQKDQEHLKPGSDGSIGDDEDSVGGAMEDQLEKLHNALDTKDRIIEAQEDQIQQLKDEAYSRDQRENQLRGKMAELRKDGDPDAKSDEESIESSEREKRWRESVDEGLQTVGALQSENALIKKDRIMLLLWNQELQKQLDTLNGAKTESESDKDVAKMEKRAMKSRKTVTEEFENQLTSLREVVSKGGSGFGKVKNSDLNNSSCEEHVAEITELRAENGKLVKKLADMKSTWIAHLDMLMSPGQAISANGAGGPKPGITRATSDAILPRSPKRGGSILKKGGNKKVKGSKFAKPIKRSGLLAKKQKKQQPTGKGLGLKKMIGYLSGALLQYFGQVAVLRGPLWICDRKVPLKDFSIDEKDYKKIYAVLTKSELLGYRSLVHAESETNTPLFQYNLKDFVSVLRIEEMMGAMEVPDDKDGGGNGDGDEEEEDDEKTGVFVASMSGGRVVFRAEGNLSREVWMDNLDGLLSE